MCSMVYEAVSGYQRCKGYNLEVLQVEIASPWLFVASVRTTYILERQWNNKWIPLLFPFWGIRILLRDTTRWSFTFEWAELRSITTSATTSSKICRRRHIAHRWRCKVSPVIAGNLSAARYPGATFIFLNNIFSYYMRRRSKRVFDCSTWSVMASRLYDCKASSENITFCCYVPEVGKLG